MTDGETSAARRRALPLALGVAAIVGLAVAARFLPLTSWASRLHETVQSSGAWGPLVLAIAYVGLTLLLVPGSVLTVAAGGIYGVVLGTAIVSIASTISVAAAFLLARYALRGRVRGWIAQSPRLAAIDEAIGREGWKIVALLRLSPVVPFGLQNYVYGVSSMRFWPCVLTSWLAMLPGTLMYAYLGALGTDAATGKDAPPAVWAMRAAGLAATIAVTVYLSRVARRAVRSRVSSAAARDGD